MCQVKNEVMGTNSTESGDVWKSDAFGFESLKKGADLWET